MKPPETLRVVCGRVPGFTMENRTKKQGYYTLWRPAHVLPHGVLGKLIDYNEKSFWQLNNDVTMARYKVHGYRYVVVAWFDNKTSERIA